MNSLTKPMRMFAAIACAATMAACSTAPKLPPTPKLVDMLGQAAQASGSGNKEQAVKLYKMAAAAYPADKTPWASIAQTRYETGQYGEAIVAAQEVLVRDPNDTVANSIIAISGLRLSTRALSDLSRQNNLSGSLRTESQDLAKLLRESLGENILIPAQPKKATVIAAPSSSRPKTKVERDKDDSANPFSGLK